jgi:hypothetical protein
MHSGKLVPTDSDQTLLGPVSSDDMIHRTALALLGGALLLSTAAGQDVATSRVAGGSDYTYYGTLNGNAYYSMASTSCNVGNVLIDWNDAQNNAPAIASNMFRMYDGRIEQLGYSWLKDSFCAVNENSCGSCQSTNCDTLGIGCADTYWSGLNDGANGRAKFQLNATTGQWPNLWSGPSGPLPARGRIAVPLTEAQDANSRYIAEVTYISEHDQLAGNGRNNASWQEFRWSSGSLSSTQNTGSVHMFDPAIYALVDEYPSAGVEELQNDHEGGTNVHGWYFLGHNATDLGGGMWRYDYMLFNMNSEQAAGGLTINLPCSVNVSNVGFKDVDYTSGSPYDGTDWTSSVSSGSVSWEVTQTHAQNPNANAVRWGMLYNFSFEADAAPISTGTALVSLFAPGTGTDLNATGVTAPGGMLALYCGPANGNSVWAGGAEITATGSTLLSDNQLDFQVTQLPGSQFGYFLMSQSQTFVPNFSGSAGNLCLGAPIIRFNNDVLNTDLFGVVNFSPDFGNLPQGTQFMVGDTWNFQFWYRDNMGGPTSNTTEGVSLNFCQ